MIETIGALAALVVGAVVLDWLLTAAMDKL